MDDQVCGPSWTGPDFSFIWLLPLTRLSATESGIDCRVLGVVTVISTFVSIASGLSVAISGFKSARFTCIVIAMG